jgi:hypothetical protein
LKATHRLLTLITTGLLLTGCIEQDVKIKLNADGSGTLTVMNYCPNLRMCDDPSLIIHSLFAPDTRARILSKNETPSFEALNVVRHSIHAVPGAPEREVEEVEFSFSNLGAALPELENLIPLMPRFSIQSNQLTVAVSHEMNEYHGNRSSDTNFFYHLDIEFPAPPHSKSGVVKENHVSWKADCDQLKAFHESEIGTVLFECSLPADAVQLDLTPRPVKEIKSSARAKPKDKESELISRLSVTIPIVSTNPTRLQEDSNAELQLQLSIPSNQVPFYYENLRIEKLVIDELEIMPKLRSKASDLFSGRNKYGREISGFPLDLQFGWNSRQMNNIDQIEASMEIAVPAASNLHKLHIDAAAVTDSVLTISNHPNMRIAGLEIEHAEIVLTGKMAKITIATTLNPIELGAIYLDTNYGLRYPAKKIIWLDQNRFSITNHLKIAKTLFGTKTPFRLIEIHFQHIPTTSFDLVFEHVEEVSMKKIVLSEENIHVN